MKSRLTKYGLSAAAVLLVAFLAGCGRTSSTLAPSATDAQGVSSDASVERGAGVLGRASESEEEMSESPDDAKWISGPAVITEPGDYRLAADFAVNSGDGIVVKASNVRLWLGGKKLTGPGNKAGRAIVLDGVQNVTVLGGHVSRFGFGAVLVGTSHSRVSGMEFAGGDETADPANGNPPQIGAMLVNSAENRISLNSFSGVNLGIFVRGGGSYQNIIRRNQVAAGQNGLLGICYNPAAGEGAAGPQHDRVSLNVISRFGKGIALSAGSRENYFVRNLIQYFDAPYADANGTNVFENNRSTQVSR